MSDERDDILDALELMVAQYLPGCPRDGWDHQFMTAGERAVAVLARHRPAIWRSDGAGIELVDPESLPPGCARLLPGDADVARIARSWSSRSGPVDPADQAGGWPVTARHDTEGHESG